MSSSIKTCTDCKTDFPIYLEDQEFYKIFDVPEPRRCPKCRLVRRLLERNAKSLYYRKCDSTGKKTLSQYHKDQPFPVYSPAAWWSENWDATTYGRDFDFSRGFFEQFLELKNTVPHCALFNTEGTMENSDFNNCTAYIKNCYLVAETDHCEECYYSNLLKKCTSLVDCSVCYQDELCYECCGGYGNYRMQYSRDCQNCRDSYFLADCAGCSDCIGCINQRHKQYMIFNKQYSKEEYEKIKADLKLNTRSGVDDLKKKTEAFFLTQPHRSTFAENNQNAVGDHLFNSKNAFMCFGSRDLEDCRYCAKLTLGVKSSMDYNSWGNQSELMYQCAGCGDQNYNLKFCVMCQKDMRNCDYCYECFSCADCFGCVGLKQKKYCILNKQYTKEEYIELRGRIIEHMKKTAPDGHSSQWGEFFPIEVGAFAYNESIAMDIYPLKKEEAIEKGYKWRDEEAVNIQTQTYVVPEDIHAVKDDITTAILACSDCGKNFKIIAQELAFYRNLEIPIPKRCPNCRHRPRMLLRNPPELWTRNCAKCSREIETSYKPDRPEIIYCEECYREAVY